MKLRRKPHPRDDELRRLRSWKADAMSVLARWEDVAQRVDVPLGEFKSVAVGKEIDRLRAEVARLTLRQR